MENCLLNPLMGGEAGEVARERDLPLYSFQVGHIVPGVGISLLGAFLIYFVGQVYLFFFFYFFFLFFIFFFQFSIFFLLFQNTDPLPPPLIYTTSIHKKNI